MFDISSWLQTPTIKVIQVEFVFSKRKYKSFLIWQLNVIRHNPIPFSLKFRIIWQIFIFYIFFRYASVAVKFISTEGNATVVKVIQSASPDQQDGNLFYFHCTVELDNRELGTLELFLNAKCSLSLWSKLAFGHTKWFLNTNLFLIKQFFNAKFDYTTYLINYYIMIAIGKPWSVGHF